MKGGKLKNNNFAWSSVQIRNAIKKKKIKTPSSAEWQIQPSSFEPTIGNEAFVLDAEVSSLFRINQEETIYESLLRLPARKRKKVDIANGFELKKGFTYLIPLRETITLGKDEYVKSSPKSSAGRLFLNTRLLADYNPCFNEVNSTYCSNREIKLWLFVQPLIFNVIIHPKITLNQLRFFKGLQFQLTPTELVEEFERHPLLYAKNQDNQYIPSKRLVTDGLAIHLNLSGDTTEGIIGLRARRNPTPIDLAKVGHYNAEDFFEPIKGDKRMYVRKGEYYLFSSAEILKIPGHLSVELRDHSHVGFIGPLHFAGFIDNGFEGDLVFEVRSDELSKNVELVDGMPISKMDVFKTKMPDKIYGKASKSNYKHQIGPRTAKYFQPFDYKYAARNYELLDRDVLVQDKNVLLKHKSKKDLFEIISENKKKVLLKDVEKGFFHSRYSCEEDSLILQPVPYLVLFGPDETVFTYTKSSEMKYYPEERLFGKRSIGIGGHIARKDFPDYIKNGIGREMEEKRISVNWKKKPELVGTIMAEENEVDRHHLGLIFIAFVDEVETVGEIAKKWKMTPIKDLQKKSKKQLEKFETWSKILIPELSKLYNKYKK